MNWENRLQDRLSARRKLGLWRERLVLQSPQSVTVTVDGRRYLGFCSNDYLGLANHPEVIDALQRGAAQWGVGAGASHLITGHFTPHEELERELARFVGMPRALLFSTGYMANLAIAATLTGRHDMVLEDRLNHASLIDAGELCRADVKRFRHTDVSAVKTLLDDNPERDCMVLTDAVFSMDGDLAPVPELVELAQLHNTLLVLDDAHGLGVLGITGRGSLEHHGVPPEPPVILMGTLGKALGTFGAFVAGAPDIIESLLQFARTYIYTTAPPPALAEATRAALQLVAAEPEHRERLRDHINRFRNGARAFGLPVQPSITPIQVIVLGEASTALAASEALRARGILIPAIRPPTVPNGTARLRVTLSAAHAEEDIERLLAALDAVVPDTCRDADPK